MSKKTRGPNFSTNEKEILIRLVTKYKDVVDNKKTDSMTVAKKNEGWRNLTEEFNSLSSFSVRNTEQLKTCWDNIKRNRNMKEITLSGGGRPDLPPPGACQSQVEAKLGPTLSGVENPSDSDAQHLEDEPTSPTEAATCKEDEKEDDCFLKFLEDKSTKTWSGWSPAPLKAKMSDPLAVKKTNSPSWLQRRRSRASLHDKLLESKLELIEIMKKKCELEAKIKRRILEEQLKQEKIKTELLELKLKKCK